MNRCSFVFSGNISIDLLVERAAKISPQLTTYNLGLKPHYRTNGHIQLTRAKEEMAEDIVSSGE